MSVAETNRVLRLASQRLACSKETLFGERRANEQKFSRICLLRARADNLHTRIEARTAMNEARETIRIL